MKLLNIFIFGILLTAMVFKSYSQPCKEIVAYYPNWQWYDRNHLVSPANIDYSKYTIINYSFFSPQSDGSILQTDAWADENLLFGEHDWVNGGYFPNTSLIDLAHNNNVKVLAAIGGWTLSNNFPIIAADSLIRRNFASQCVTLLSEFNFDGIDIDWEYPGYVPNGGTSADGISFTLFLQEIRDSIDAYGLITGKDYLLSACFSADPLKMTIVEWQDIIPVIDMFNLMSYDFFGSFSNLSNHNSPLYAPLVGDPQFNIHSAFTNITQLHGVPSSKVNIGIPFYGRSVTGCTGLHQPNAGSPDASTFWEDEGSPTYYNVVKNSNLFTQYWDSQAMVPYMVGNNINTFLSYDNEQSVGLKAEYVVNSGARGVIIWEMTGDYVETSAGSGIIQGTPLVDTLNQVFCSVITVVEELKFEEVLLYPNPVELNCFTNIKLDINNNGIDQIRLLNILGKEISINEFEIRNSGDRSLQLLVKVQGTYFIIINHREKVITCKVIVI